MIYLNQAATTWPKPRAVEEAVAAALRQPPQQPFRSTVAERDTAAACREGLGRLLGIADSSRIRFASGATDALNRLFGGLELGDRPVVVTQTEHNSVLRPLFNRRGAPAPHIVPCDACGRVSPSRTAELLAALASSQGAAADGSNPFAGLLVVNHCSNVTGCVQDLAALADAAHRHRFLLLADLSQSAGTLPVDIDGWGVDLAVFTGHKGLFGPTGTGGWYHRRGIPLRPVLFGGTGRESSRLRYDTAESYEFEVGTPNTVGLAGLEAGVRYLLDRGVERIAARERALLGRVREALAADPNIRLFDAGDAAAGPLLSFNFRGLKPHDAGYILHNAYGITLRSGLHCAPLIHEALGTLPHGTLRLGVSDLTRDEEIDALLEAVAAISRTL